MILIADSGSTKTDWCITDGGATIARLTTRGINPCLQNAAEIEDTIRQELLGALPTADGIEAVCFYGAGCTAERKPLVSNVLGSCFAAATIEVHSDLLAAARALCNDGEGIACILGTGSNSCLYDGQRIVANVPAMGFILGDEGSGAVLGRLFVNALYKGGASEMCVKGPEGQPVPSVMESGSWPVLRREFEQEMGLTMGDIIERVYRQPMANRFLASLSPFIHRHLNCEAVRMLVEENFRCFLRSNVAHYGRRDLTVSAVGSIAHHYKELFVAAVEGEGYGVGTVAQSPMEGLIAYHTQHAR